MKETKKTGDVYVQVYCGLCTIKVMIENVAVPIQFASLSFIPVITLLSSLTLIGNRKATAKTAVCGDRGPCHDG